MPADMWVELRVGMRADKCVDLCAGISEPWPFHYLSVLTCMSAHMFTSWDARLKKTLRCHRDSASMHKARRMLAHKHARTHSSNGTYVLHWMKVCSEMAITYAPVAKVLRSVLGELPVVSECQALENNEHKCALPRSTLDPRPSTLDPRP